MHGKSWKICFKHNIIKNTINSFTRQNTIFYKEDEYGSKSGNGSWNGIMALVTNGMADIGIGQLGGTKGRSELVDFYIGT